MHTIFLDGTQQATHMTTCPAILTALPPYLPTCIFRATYYPLRSTPDLITAFPTHSLLHQRLRTEFLGLYVPTSASTCLPRPLPVFSAFTFTYHLLPHYT